MTAVPEPTSIELTEDEAGKVWIAWSDEEQGVTIELETVGGVGEKQVVGYAVIFFDGEDKNWRAEAVRSKYTDKWRSVNFLKQLEN